jgi:hypothetical protein
MACDVEVLPRPKSPRGVGLNFLPWARHSTPMLWAGFCRYGGWLNSEAKGGNQRLPPEVAPSWRTWNSISGVSNPVGGRSAIIPRRWWRRRPMLVTGRRAAVVTRRRRWADRVRRIRTRPTLARKLANGLVLEGASSSPMTDAGQNGGKGRWFQGDLATKRGRTEARPPIGGHPAMAVEVECQPERRSRSKISGRYAA